MALQARSTRVSQDSSGVIRLPRRVVVQAGIGALAALLLALLLPRLATIPSFMPSQSGIPGDNPPALLAPLQVCDDNGACDPDENSCNCPNDCGPSCGNDSCDCGEKPSDCPNDCGPPPPACGDGSCNGGETSCSCAQDCGNYICGDGSCQCDEASYCPQDCSGPPPTGCGDSVCSGNENSCSCPQDCGYYLCGDLVCQCDEASLCPGDCQAGAVCGNTICEAGENSTTCPADCEALTACGNGNCNPIFEDATNCPADCAVKTPTSSATAATATNAATATKPAQSFNASVTPTDAPTGTATTAATPSATANIGEALGTGEPKRFTTSGCRVVDEGELDNDGVKRAARAPGLSPVGWAICDNPPVELCLPIDDSDSAGQTISLVDCPAGGSCATHPGEWLAGEDRVACFRARESAGLCGNGCAVVRPGSPLAGLLQSGAVVPVLLVVIIAGAIAVWLFLLRRRPDQVEEWTPEDIDEQRAAGESEE